MVPAPKTSAPLGALYRVRWWVAVPEPYVEPKSWRTWTPLLVVEESGTSPAGRAALSGASSHSYPSVPSAQGGGLAWGLRGDTGVAPDAHLAVGRRHVDRGGAGVDPEHRARDRVLRTTAVGRRAEAGIAPSPGPDVGVARRPGVDLGVRVGLLVTDQGSPVGGRAAGGAGLPAGLPEALVAREEGEVDAGGPGRLDVGALGPGPVLVVADGEEGLVLAGSRSRTWRCPPR